MGQRISRRNRVMPIVTPGEVASRSGELHIKGRTHSRTKKRYFADGRLLLGSPRVGIMTYPDGSYLCGQFEEGESFGYCVYRDIAGRLIYTGYMEHTSYQGWGAIWNETGDWPEHITFWCCSAPGNRVLRIQSPTCHDADWVTYKEDGPEVIGSMLMTSSCKVIFKELRDLVIDSKEINEESFSKIIQLYTEARTAADRATTIPPSPHHGPSAGIIPIGLRIGDSIFSSRLTPSPEETSSSGDERSIRNPLNLFRVPPRPVRPPRLP